MANFSKYEKIKDAVTGKLLPEIVEEVKSSISPSTPNDFGTVGKVYSDKAVIPPQGYKNTPFIIIVETASHDFITIPYIEGSLIKGYGFSFHKSAILDFSSATLSINTTINVNFSRLVSAICSDAYGEQLLLENGVSPDRIEVLPPKTNSDFGIKLPINYDGSGFMAGTNIYNQNSIIMHEPFNIDVNTEITGMYAGSVGSNNMDFSKSFFEQRNAPIAFFGTQPVYCSTVELYKRFFNKYKNTLILVDQNAEPAGGEIYVQQEVGGQEELLSNYVGKDRQLVVDTRNYSIRVMDGKTKGGHPVGSKARDLSIMDRLDLLEASYENNTVVSNKNKEDISTINVAIGGVSYASVYNKGVRIDTKKCSL